ncbi:hypothetical protein OGAPHI_003059 [Ogataea philodendri]|uniref:Uncharacterized protein n=1 Tax=Ogataea philodendri TaxID=1378263 RepID=A0A9P8P8Z3_9ASCO|nr:uncharacterized protein OGAPHI_003059 [Ogataea philodendri]KAH3667410.1 hypothetical protein OGAPHI_003059 [Ogataea philodendri]
MSSNLFANLTDLALGIEFDLCKEGNFKEDFTSSPDFFFRRFGFSSVIVDMEDEEALSWPKMTVVSSLMLRSSSLSDDDRMKSVVDPALEMVDNGVDIDRVPSSGEDIRLDEADEHGCCDSRSLLFR